MVVFLVAAFLVVVFLVAAFLVTAFLVTAFLVVAFLVTAFLVAAFLAVTFLVVVFLLVALGAEPEPVSGSCVRSGFSDPEDASWVFLLRGTVLKLHAAHAGEL